MENDVKVTLDNFNDENIKNVRARIQERLTKAEAGAKGQPEFRMINDGPKACEVTVTEGSRNCIADILCCSYDYLVK